MCLLYVNVLRLCPGQKSLTALPYYCCSLDVATLCQVNVVIARLEQSVDGTGSHGRKYRTAGHIKAVLLRAQVTQQVHDSSHSVKKLKALSSNTSVGSQFVTR